MTGQTRPVQVYVTAHAMLRFLERVRGFRFDKEKRQIQDACRGVHNGTVKAFGHLFEVKNGNVVTVSPDTGFPCRTKREEARAR